MLVKILLILFYFLTPILLIYLCHKSSTLNKIGAVVLAYAVGLIFGNIRIIPRGSVAYKELLAGKVALPSGQLNEYFNQGIINSKDVFLNQISSTQDLLMTIVIPLAIPLLLFSLDVKKWLKMAKEAFKSLALAMVSLLVVIVGGYFLFQDSIHESWKVSGMLVGIYSGGTPNLAAIATAVDVSPNTFILTHTYDLVLGAICLLFLLTLAQRTFNYFLPHFKDNHAHLKLKNMLEESEGVDNYLGMLTKKGFLQLLKALGLSILVFAIGGALSLVVPQSAQMVTVILTITTLGLVLSMVKSINKIEKNLFNWACILLSYFA